MVGSRVDLHVLSNNEVYYKLMESGVIELTPIKTVPEECSEVRFIRNRSIEKKISEKKALEINQYMPHFSLSGNNRKHRFLMHVGLSEAEARVDGVYTTYGLSKQGGATFPLF